MVQDEQYLEYCQRECDVHARHALQVADGDADRLFRLFGSLGDWCEYFRCIGREWRQCKADLECGYVGQLAHSAQDVDHGVGE